MGYGFLTGVKGLQYRPNLLINGDFLINQMGGASYTLGASRTYTVDQWSLFYNAAISSATVTPISGGGATVACTLTTSGNYNVFGQDIEFLDYFKGKVFTISAKLSSVSANAFIGVYDGVDNYRSAAVSEDGVVKITFRMNAGASRFLVYIGFNGVQTHTVNVEWAQAQFGAVFMPFVSPDPATELVRCQRFFYIIKKTDNYTEYGIGWATSLTVATIMIDVPTMRVTPTLIVSGNGDFAIRNGANYITATSSVTPPSLRAYVGKTALVQFTTTLNMATDYTVTSLRSNVSGSWIAFDARQY